MKKIFLVLLVLISTFIFASCGSVPKSKNFATYNDETAFTHDYVRRSQKEAHNGKFAGTLRAMNALQRKFSNDNCYRIHSMAAQWGILEPEVVFTGEGVFGTREHVLIYVAPLLADKVDYPALQDDPSIRVYRLDVNAPHANSTLDILKQALHQGEMCVQLHRIPDLQDKDKVHGLIASQLMPVARAHPPIPPGAPAPGVEENKAPENKPAEAPAPVAPEASTGKPGEKK